MSHSLIKEESLREAVRNMLTQSLILASLAWALIFSFWRLNYFKEQAQIYKAVECSILLVIAWFGSGLLLIRRAQSDL